MKENSNENSAVRTPKKFFLSILAGVISGFVNGMFGGGGGMIVVPMLEKCLDYKSKNAHATAILIILPLSVISGILYATFGNFDFQIGLPVIIGVLAGGVVGAFALKKLSSKWVVLIFALVMAVAGAKYLFF